MALCCFFPCLYLPTYLPPLSSQRNWVSVRLWKRSNEGRWAIGGEQRMDEGCGSGCGRANMLFIIICSCCYFSCLLLLLMSLLAVDSPSVLWPLDSEFLCPIRSYVRSVLDVVHIAAGNAVVVVSAIVVIFIALHYCCFAVLGLLLSLLLLSLVCFQQIHNFVDIKLSHVVEFWFDFMRANLCMRLRAASIAPGRQFRCLGNSMRPPVCV